MATNPFNRPPSLGGILFDQILDMTGTIGSKIKGYSFKNYAYDVEAMASNPYDKSYLYRTKIITFDRKVIVFDAATEVTAEFPSKITQYPVEDKATISDHVINENPKFSVSGIFSDQTGNLNPAKGTVTVMEVREILMKMRDDRQVVSLITDGERITYTDLIVTNISIPRKSGLGSSMILDIQFEKVRKVTAKRTTVYISTKNKPTQAKTTGNKDGGTKKIPVPPAKPELDESKLADEIKKDPALYSKYQSQLLDDGFETSQGKAMGTAEQMSGFLKKNKSTFNPDDYWQDKYVKAGSTGYSTQ